MNSDFTDSTLAERILHTEKGKTALFFSGQAGFILRNAAGRILGHDLYLSNCLERMIETTGFRRLIPILMHPEDVEFDVLIASHPHYDHFDLDALPALMTGTRTRLYASVNCRAEVSRTLIQEKKVTYVQPGDAVEDSGFSIRFLPCDHGEDAPDAVGLLIEADGRSVMILGDTSFRQDLARMFAALGPVDVLIAPINGRFGNLNEQECADTAAIINPRLLIPCHYGMTVDHGGDPEKFRRIMDTQYPAQAYRMMRPGEGLTL